MKKYSVRPSGLHYFLGQGEYYSIKSTLTYSDEWVYSLIKTVMKAEVINRS